MPTQDRGRRVAELASARVVEILRGVREQIKGRPDEEQMSAREVANRFKRMTETERLSEIERIGVDDFLRFYTENKELFDGNVESV